MAEFKIVFLLGVCIICASCISAQNNPDGILNASNSLDQFALKLLSITRKNLPETSNIALSPYTVWILMTIMSEGAAGNTLREMQKTLQLPEDMNTFRKHIRDLSLNLMPKSNGVQLDLTNGIFVTNDFPLNTSFQKISQDNYNVAVKSINFRDTQGARKLINDYISTATKDKIKNLVNLDDIRSADIFMTSILYFKGIWRFPFNKSETIKQPFYADDGQTEIAQVDMMHQSAPFPYIPVQELKSFVAELPYGDGEKYGMFVLVPAKGETLTGVLDKLSYMNFNEVILDKLAKAAVDFEDEDVDIILPKFTVNSEFTMNVVLNQMGINEIFNSEKAELPGIFSQDLYLNRLLQKAIIEVDEEGTVASSASGGSFAYKTMKPKLVANKPFAYFIVDKKTRSIIFEGEVSNPSTA